MKTLSLRLDELTVQFFVNDDASKLDERMTLFEEAGAVDALWRVCDAATEESAAAELAAGILDDFYDEEDEAAEEATATTAAFQFHSPAMPTGGFNFSAPAPVPPGSCPPSMGRGRGRVLPAWMPR